MPTVVVGVPRWASTCGLDIRYASSRVRKLAEVSRIPATRFAERFIDGGQIIQVAVWNQYRTAVDSFPAQPTARITR